MQPLKILIVDDDRTYNLLLKKVLSNNDNEVMICFSGEDAIDKLQSATYDIILLDYKLGKISGIDILQWIYDKKIEIPVILITAFGSEDVALEAWKWKAQNYLIKGVIDINEIPKFVTDTYKKWIETKKK